MPRFTGLGCIDAIVAKQGYKSACKAFLWMLTVLFAIIVSRLDKHLVDTIKVMLAVHICYTARLGPC